LKGFLAVRGYEHIVAGTLEKLLEGGLKKEGGGPSASSEKNLRRF
jgi:hypothetical protein